MSRAETRFSLCVVTFAMIFLPGCKQSAQDKLVGNWTASVEFNEAVVQAKLDEAGKNRLKRVLIEKFVEAIKSGSMEMELKADGSFTSTVRLGQLSRDGYGKWEVLTEADNQATVRFSHHGGKIEDKTLLFASNDSFSTDIPGEQKDLAVFRCNRVQSQAGESPQH